MEETAHFPKFDPSTQEVLERGDCPDVNKIGYDGDAQGEYCGLPFLMNERYFETCTRARERPDGAVVTEDKYWCPSPEERFCDGSVLYYHRNLGAGLKYVISFHGYVTATQTRSFHKTSLCKGVDATTLVWNLTTPTALCTSHLFPADNGCEDHYEAVEDLCLRISPFPKSFTDARATCEREGSYLAQVTSQAVHANLTQTLSDKSKMFRYRVTIPSGKNIPLTQIWGMVDCYCSQWTSHLVSAKSNHCM